MRERRIRNEKKKEWPDDWTLLGDCVMIPLSLQPPLRSGTMVVTLPAEYPFKGPTFCFNGSGWSTIYRTGTIFHEDMALISKIDCLCCNSLMCPNNWHCCSGITEVVQEFLKIITLKVRTVERFHCKRLQEYYLHGIPIHEYL